MLEASIRDVVVEAERFAESGGGDIVALVRVRGKGRALSSFDGPTAVRMAVSGGRV